jgi:hypothetical protein
MKVEPPIRALLFFPSLNKNNHPALYTNRCTARPALGTPTPPATTHADKGIHSETETDAFQI